MGFFGGGTTRRKSKAARIKELQRRIDKINKRRKEAETLAKLQSTLRKMKR